MEQYQALYNQLGKGLEAIQEAEKLRATVTELDSTIKAQADTIRLSQEEQKALQQEITELNNTIKLLKEQLEKPVPPVVPAPEKPLPVVKESREPLRIEQGGHYKNVKIYAPNGSAVTFQGDVQATFENCEIQASKHGFENHSGGRTNLKLINCTGSGLTPTVTGDPRRFVSANNVVNLDIQNCSTDGIGFLTTQGEFYGDANKGQGIKVLYCEAKNINGRNKSGFAKANFVQIMNNNGIPAEIAYSRVENEYGKTHMEDTINIYNARGYANKPMLIHDILIVGAFYDPSQEYSATQRKVYYSGGGIILDGDGDYNRAPAYIHIYNCYVIGTGNYGIGFAAGHHNKAYNNVVINAAVLADGRNYDAVMHNTSGIWSNPQGITRGAMDNNVFENNTVGVNWKSGRNDISIMKGATATGTKHLPSVTKADEIKAILEWEHQHKDIKIGLLN